jgi:hypothetical protein
LTTAEKAGGYIGCDFEIRQFLLSFKERYCNGLFVQALIFPGLDLLHLYYGNLCVLTKVTKKQDSFVERDKTITEGQK